MKSLQRALKRLASRKAWQARAVLFVVVAVMVGLLEPVAAHASTLTGTSFTVMDPRTSIPGNRYDWGFTTATTSTLSRVTMGLPLGTTGSNRYLALNGNNYNANDATTPDSPANSVTGDIDIRVKVALNNWTSGNNQPLIAKRNASTSWSLAFLTNNKLEFAESADGSSASYPSVTPTGLVNGVASWFRITRVVSSGVTTFFQSSDGNNWTTLGSGTFSAGSGLYDSSDAVEIGSWFGNVSPLQGKVYFASIANAVNGTNSSPTSCGATSVVQCFNPNNDTISGSSWTAQDPTGETWTVNRSGTWLPADIASDLSAMNINGLPSGGVAQNRELDHIASYVLPTATSVPSGTAIKLGFAGFTNTTTANSYTSAITTYDNNAIPVAIDNATTSSVAFTGATIATAAGNGNLLSPTTGSVATVVNSFPEGLTIAGNTVYTSDIGSDTVSALNTSTGLVTRFAGNGLFNNAYGGPAINGSVAAPENITQDSSGNMYIIDRFNQLIKKVDTSGNISIAVGSSIFGYSGDGNQATTNVAFRNLSSIAFSPAGDLYIADTGNCVIRKVNHSTNVITTAYGTGTCSYTGDGGAGSTATFSSPTDLTFDATGNLFIVDQANCAIRKVDTSGNISTYAGGNGCAFSGDNGPATAAKFSYPFGLALDSNGNMYVSEDGSAHIRKITSGGIISTVAGTGGFGYNGDGIAATSAQIWNPRFIKTDGAGNVYFSDTYNYRVREINITNGLISTIMGNGSGPSTGDGGAATAASFYNPGSASSDNLGNVYVADQANNAIRRIDQWGTITKIAGQDASHSGSSGDSGLATAATLNNPASVAVAANGAIYIADTSNQKIRAITGGNISTLASLGTNVNYVAVNPVTQDVWSSSSDCRIRKTTSGGVTTVVAGNGTCSTSGDGSIASSATVNNPGAMVFDGIGDAYFVDGQTRVRKIDTVTANISTVAGGGVTNGSNNVQATAGNLSGLTSLAIDALGNLYVASYTGVMSFTDGGSLQLVAGTFGSGYTGDGGSARNATFLSISGLAISQGSLYVVDNHSQNVRKIATYTPIAPLVNNDVMSVPMSTARSYPILSNDWSQSYEMDPSSVKIVTAPAHGAVTLTVPNTEASTMQANYTPTNSYTGTDSFVYQACDTTKVLCNTATVSISISSNQVTTFAGGPTEGYASSLAINPGRGTRFGRYLFVSDTSTNVIRRVDLYSNQAVVIAGDEMPGYLDGNGQTALLTAPRGITAAPDGTLYIADYGNGALRKYGTNGNLSTVSNAIALPLSVALGRNGSLYATSGNTVYRWNGTSFDAFAGNYTTGYSGDGGLATSAALNSPQGLLGAPNGDIYISDNVACVIRKVNTSGIISLIGGTPNTCSNTGNNVAATSATMVAPKGMSMDASGNLYIADFGSSIIRKIDTSGVMTTVATTGETMNQPIDVSAGANGELYVMDFGRLLVEKISTSNVVSIVFGNGDSSFAGDGLPALNTQLPQGSQGSPLSIDASGNIYSAQGAGTAAVNNTRIRKIDGTTGLVSTVVGSNYNAVGSTIDSSGRLLFSDYPSCRIFRVETNLAITVIAGTGSCISSGNNGLAVSAGINHPYGLAYDSKGNLYFAEANGNFIRKIDTNGYITTVAGTGTAGFSGDGGPATAAKLWLPTQLAIDHNDNVIFADYNNSHIRMIDKNGIITTVAGAGAGYSGDGGPATAALIYQPTGLAIDTDNNIFFSDAANSRIRKVDASTGIITTVVGSGSPGFLDNTTYLSAYFNGLGQLAFDSNGNLYVADVNNQRVRKVANIGATATNNLSNASWNVVPGNTGHTNLRERFIVTPSVTTTSKQMKFTMPTSAAGTSLTVVSQYGVTGAVTAVLSGTTLTVSYPSQTLTAGVPIGFAIEGWTNGGANGSYTSSATEYDSAGTTAIGWARSNVVNVTASGSPTAVDAGFGSVWQKSLTATSSSTSIANPVSPSATADNTTLFTVATNGNLTSNGFALGATSLTAPIGTIAAITADQTTSVASGSFTANHWGVQVTSTSGSNAGATGTSLYSGLPSTPGAVLAGTSTIATAAFTPRVKINYLTPAGTYASTLTWRLSPGV